MKKIDGRPRHQQIAAELRARIMSGELGSGTQLPTTQQLMAQYGVTSQTVQRTLSVLKDEGFLIGRVGVGVFVREVSPLTIVPASYLPASHENESYPWTTEAAKRSQRGTIRLLEVAEVVPPPEVLRAFELADGGVTHLRHQLLFLDDQPVELAWIYHLVEIARSTPLSERRRIRGGTPSILSELGYPPREWTDKLSVRLATTEELEALELPDDVPVIRTFRTVYTDGMRPIEVQVLIKGGHLYELLYQQQVR